MSARTCQLTKTTDPNAEVVPRLGGALRPGDGRTRAQFVGTTSMCTGPDQLEPDTS